METRGHSPVDTSLNYNGSRPHTPSRVSSQSALREICSARDSAGAAQVAHETHGTQWYRGSHFGHNSSSVRRVLKGHADPAKGRLVEWAQRALSSC